MSKRKHKWSSFTTRDGSAACSKCYGTPSDAVHQVYDCDGCKYWSELVAQSIGGGPVKALCLNPESPHTGRMVRAGCPHYVHGTAIDLPF